MANKGGRRNRGGSAFYHSLIGGLVDFAKNELALGTRQSDDATLRDHLLKHWRDTGEMPPELGPVECPDSMRYLWEYFTSLSKRRSGIGYPSNAISNQELRSWAAGRGIALEPFEVEALEELEAAYLDYQTRVPK